MVVGGGTGGGECGPLTAVAPQDAAVLGVERHDAVVGQEDGASGACDGGEFGGGGDLLAPGGLRRQRRGRRQRGVGGGGGRDVVDRVDQCPRPDEGGTECQCWGKDHSREVGAGTARYPNALVAGESLIGLLSGLAPEAAPAARILVIAETYRGTAQVVQQWADAQEERG